MHLLAGRVHKPDSHFPDEPAMFFDPSPHFNRVAPFRLLCGQTSDRRPRGQNAIRAFRGQPGVRGRKT